MGNNQSITVSTPTENTPINNKEVRVKTNTHTNPEKDKGGICPICRDPKCGYMTN
jgi:hypothetical protein